MPSSLRRPRRLSFLLVLLALLVGASAAAAKPAPRPPDRSRLGTLDTGFRDSVREGRPPRSVRKATLHAARYGGAYPVAGGQSVRVFLSDAYEPDDEVNQAWAEFFASLTHRLELSRVTVYIAPLGEMHNLCGQGSDACYFPSDHTLVFTVDPLGDGSSAEEAAVHEYGHHVAEYRRNDVGPAGDWGPEYWATYEEVCWLEGQGRAFPGAEGVNYARNPGEAWAETFRVLNAYAPGAWPIIAPIFRPDQRALGLARRDVVNPYRGGRTIERSGQFKKGGSRWREFVVPIQNDGTVDVRVAGGGTLDADIYIYAPNGKTKLDSSTANGRNERYRDNYCGYRQLDIAVYRYSGTGTFKLTAKLPFFS
ncbi:MAG TPA: hypothetical protein VJT75_00510 [Thermoleophilaceae bacterium]|nr:hypothetical protein [Thermoleophilaceae bacterium]